jgi:signal transduction histidine kinase
MIAMVAGMTAAVDLLVRHDRTEQVDADLDTRVTVLNGVVREFFLDPPARGSRPGGPPPPRLGGPGWPPPGRRGGRPGGPPPPPTPERQSQLAARLDSATRGLFAGETGFYYVVWFRDGSVIAHSPNASADVRLPDPGDRDTLAHFHTRGDSREVVHCTGIGECALAGVPLGAERTTLARLRWQLIAAGLGVLTLAIGVGWWLTRSALSPIDAISHAAARISDGNLAERIPVDDADTELGRLAAVLNHTFGRLEAAFQRQRQFTADAAHELRTPLAVLITEAQTTLARERSAPEYRETVAGSLETAQQMRRLTEALLALARIDDAGKVTREPVDLAAAAEAAVERARPAATTAGLTVASHLEPALASGTRERVDLIVANLVANAIAYNRPGGSITVSTRPDGADAVLVVADTGIGIAAAHLPQIFDRFYRVDESRAGSDGHAGLGLAICRAITDTEAGDINITSIEGQGTTVTVRLPRAPRDAAATLG